MAVQESTENVGFTIRTYLGALSDWFYVKYRKTVSIVNLNSVEAKITIPYAYYDIFEVTVIFTMEGNVVDDIDLVLSSEMTYCEEFNKYLGFCCKVSPLDLFKTNDFNSLFVTIEKMFLRYNRFHENKVVPLLDEISELDFLNDDDLFCQHEESGNYTIRQIFFKNKIFDKFLTQEKKDCFLEAGYSQTDAVFEMQVWSFIEMRLIISSETWKPQKIQFFTLPKWKDLIEKNIMADIPKYRKNFLTSKYMKAVLIPLKDSVNGHLQMTTRRDLMAKLLGEYGEDIVYFDSENFASCQIHIKQFQEIGKPIFKFKTLPLDGDHLKVSCVIAFLGSFAPFKVHYRASVGNFREWVVGYSLFSLIRIFLLKAFSNFDA